MARGPGGGAALGGFVGTFSKAPSALRGSKEQKTRDKMGKMVRHGASCCHRQGPPKTPPTRHVRRKPGGDTADGFALAASPPRRQQDGAWRGDESFGGGRGQESGTTRLVGNRSPGTRCLPVCSRPDHHCGARSGPVCVHRSFLALLPRAGVPIWVQM